MKWNRFFQTAFETIQTRDKGTLEYSLAAILVRGGNILSIGVNKQKTNSFIDAFKNNAWTNVHAECDAILQVRRKIDLTGAKIYVARMTSHGRVSNACPCEMCQKVMARYGIRRAIYTIDDFTFDSLNPQEYLKQRMCRELSTSRID